MRAADAAEGAEGAAAKTVAASVQQQRVQHLVGYLGQVLQLEPELRAQTA
jgi:hypothetical protein